MLLGVDAGLLGVAGVIIFGVTVWLLWYRSDWPDEDVEHACATQACGLLVMWAAYLLIAAVLDWIVAA